MKLKSLYITVASILVVSGIFFLLLRNPFSNQDTSQNPNEAPKQPIHWHPKLTIIIKGEKQLIPAGIGINIGNSMDNQISGMRMAPTHTHESDGTLHLENNRPWQKPETLTLGYFFEVWNKNFSSSCIFEYCNGAEGTLTMTVNGKPNYEFGKYVMKDGDEITLEYK